MGMWCNVMAWYGLLWAHNSTTIANNCALCLHTNSRHSFTYFHWILNMAKVNQNNPQVKVLHIRMHRYKHMRILSTGKAMRANHESWAMSHQSVIWMGWRHPTSKKGSLAQTTHTIKRYNQRVIDWRMIIPGLAINAEVGNWNWFVRSIAPMSLIASPCHTLNTCFANVWQKWRSCPSIAIYLFVSFFLLKIKLFECFSLFSTFETNITSICLRVRQMKKRLILFSTVILWAILSGSVLSFLWFDCLLSSSETQN